MSNPQVGRQYGEAGFESRTPFVQEGIRALVVHCSDGRFGQQIEDFLHVGLSVAQFDRVALPGGAACLAGMGKSIYDRAALQRHIEFLTEAHGLERVILIAHQGCGYYQDVWTGFHSVIEQQAMDIRKAVQQIHTWNSRLDISTYFARTDGGVVSFEPWGMATRSSS